jgi:hypothetical protein
LVLEVKRKEQPQEPEEQKKDLLLVKQEDRQDKLRHSYFLDKSVRLVLGELKREQPQGLGVKRQELLLVKQLDRKEKLLVSEVKNREQVFVNLVQKLE